jgi:hypothetical protein
MLVRQIHETRLKILSSVGLWTAILSASAVPAGASQIGTIYVCYACQNSGNTAIDAALTANPGVAGDGILFAIINTSAFAITGGTFSVSNSTPADSFSLPTIAAGATFILMPGITSDGGSHTAGGLFVNRGITQDTSDGDGGVTDSSIFKFTGTSNSLAVTSTTFGSSTGTPGTFTPGDPSLDLPYRSPTIAGSSISFIGDGPSGDADCTNCYFGEVATLNTPAIVGGTPEPGTFGLFLGGAGTLGWLSRRKSAKRRA